MFCRKIKWFCSCLRCFLIQILFLNKTDLFQEKIRHSGRHLRLYFSKYKGRCLFCCKCLFPACVLEWILLICQVDRYRSVGIDGTLSQELMVTWTPLPISSQPCSRRVATDPCSTTTPRPRTRPAFRWSSTWLWIRSAKTTWCPSSCCKLLLYRFHYYS